MCFQPSNFQQWANASGIIADPSADNNNNGVVDIADFTFEQPFCPEIEPNGTLSLTIREEALFDGVSVDLVFSQDLNAWTIADTSTLGIKITNSTINANGDHILTFEANDPSANELFTRLQIDMP